MLCSSHILLIFKYLNILQDSIRLWEYCHSQTMSNCFKDLVSLGIAHILFSDFTLTRCDSVRLLIRSFDSDSGEKEKGEHEPMD